MQSKTVEIAGVGPVLFERSRKARRLIISVRPSAQVRVAVPYGSSFQRAEEFVHAKVDWIQGQLVKMRAHSQSEGSTKPAVDIIDKEEARRKLIARLEYLAAQHDFSYNKVFIRNQKTRLGTCSSKNNIGLNIKVSCLPQELMDYVILHELAHTRVKNHGKEFWMLMDKLVGDGKAEAKRVREYSIRHLLGSPQMPVGQPTTKEGRVIESYELLASAIFCTPVRAADIRTLKETADTLIEQLPIGLPQYHSRNQAVLRALFGLDGEPKSRAEIGSEVGLSPERIRQIRNQALRMLRHPSRSKELSRLIVTAGPR